MYVGHAKPIFIIPLMGSMGRIRLTHTPKCIDKRNLRKLTGGCNMWTRLTMVIVKGVVPKRLGLTNQPIIRVIVMTASKCASKHVQANRSV